jgi:hypothetical protein
MAETKKYSIQQSFFEKVKAMTPPALSLPNEISEILEISIDGAYRRIRGETALSLDEYFAICSHFRIPPDSLYASGNGSVTFNYSPLVGSPANFVEYFERLITDMTRIVQIPDHKFVFTAEDIPIFHYFNYPTLSAFKLYFWQRSILNFPEFADTKFDPDEISPELKKLSYKTYQLYNKINGTEIWSEKTITGLLNQLHYSYETGAFRNKNDFHAVVNEVEEMIQYLHKASEKSHKFDIKSSTVEPLGGFHLQQLELMIGINTIMVHLGEERALYLVFNSLNTIMTTHKFFCNETENWLGTMMKKAVPISGTAEKQRNIFFRNMYERIELLRAKVPL